VTPDPAAAPLVDLVVEEEGWLAALPDLAEVAERAARLALEGAGIAPEGREIAVLACDDTRIVALNAEFRGKPAPTNVLSWPTFDLASLRAGEAPPPPPEGPSPLGDVAISLQTTVREANDAGRPLKDHATHLILHACLHLLGYDHETGADAVLMEGIESRQLARLGITDPYDEGDAGTPRN
jgi:probable rRNA maturation factor